ncbi:MAG: hypothetical protein HQK92_05380 [Nitrospirae bacterium]|nr:hypothetical protein [Nitrospirota bacterium]
MGNSTDWDKLVSTIGRGMLFGYMASLGIFFLIFPIGLLLFVARINWIALFISGGIPLMRKTLVVIHIVCMLAAVGYSVWKNFYRKEALIEE